MKTQRERQPIISEVDAAWTQARTLGGDPWPELVLAYNAGEKKPLTDFVRKYGLPPDSERSHFVAGVIEGKLPTTHEKNAFKRDEILSAVRNRLPFVATESEAFAQVAEEFSRDGFPISYDGVKKLVQRNRKHRLHASAKGTQS